MGADTFTSIGIGKTPQEAFREAKDRAAWEHGHGGYTGTIAEKGDFVMFALPPGVMVNKFFDWITSEYAISDRGDSYRKDTLAWWEKQPRGTEGRTAKISELRRAIAKHEREYDRFWKKIPAQHHRMVKNAAMTYDDKWGSAVAIQLKPADQKRFASSIEYQGGKRRGQNVYLFTGYASC